MNRAIAAHYCAAKSTAYAAWQRNRSNGGWARVKTLWQSRSRNRQGRWYTSLSASNLGGGDRAIVGSTLVVDFCRACAEKRGLALPKVDLPTTLCSSIRLCVH